MQTTDEDLLFQTSAQIAQGLNKDAKRKAASSIGHPIQVGKVIEVTFAGPDAFIAESGWQARRLDLRTNKTLRTYRGHQGPVTSVASQELEFPDGSRRRILFTGSWDKTIKVWEVESGNLLTSLVGHTDFVKSLTLLPGRLISTSSDRTVRLWDLGSVAKAGIESIGSTQVVKIHTRPVDQCVTATRMTGAALCHVVWTADSLGVIHEWAYDQEKGELNHARVIPGHATSVTDLQPVEDGLWSASMDKSAQFFDSRSGKTQNIAHESSVHSVLLLPEDCTSRSILITGSDDEDLRLWETEDEWKTYRMISRVPGHCGPVTAIRCVADGQNKYTILTGSLDGTLRRWTIPELLNPSPLDYTPTKLADAHMTEEEEKELAELLSDEEE